MFEDSGLCVLEIARALMVFADDTMLPTPPSVSSALRVLAGAALVLLRTSEGANY